MQHSQKLELLRELNSVLQTIDEQIEEVEKTALELGCLPRQVKNYDGSFMLTPIVIARAEVLIAIANLHAAQISEKESS